MENLPGIKRRKSGKAGKLLVNLFTFLILVATLCLAAAFVALLINPWMSFNPFQPPTIPATLGSPSPTITPAQALPATWTSTVTATEAPTETPTPTPPPTETPEPPDVEETPDPEEVPFALQPGSPIGIPNYLSNGLGCEYLGLGGQVFALDGAPISGLVLRLGGELDGETLSMESITGSATEIGPGGYLFDIADLPVASEDSIWVQIDDGSGTPLSARAYVSTTTDCNQNLLLVNWRQIREQ